MKKISSAAIAAILVISSLALSACTDNPFNGGNGVRTGSVASENEQSSKITAEESKDEPSDIKDLESKPEITSEQLTQIKDYLNTYKSVPEFTLSSTPIDAASISNGKTVTFIADNMSNAFTSLVTSQFQKAAKSAGFSKIIAEESDGTPAFYNEQLENAQTGSDIVVMYGDINKDVVGSSIERVQAHGKKVISVGNVGNADKDHFVDYTVPINFQLAGKLMTDWAIADTSAKVNALAINNSDSMVSSAIYAGFAEEFKKYVTSGYCTVLSGSSIEIGNGLTEKIMKAINDDSNLNYIIVLDESMIADTVSAVEQSGKKIKVVATGGGNDAFGAAETGKLEMLVAQSYEWTAYATTDYALRVLNKSELPEIQDVPVRIVTAESIKNDLAENTYNIDGFYEICFGSNFITGYAEIWGL